MTNIFYRILPKIISNRAMVWLFEVMRRKQKRRPWMRSDDDNVAPYIHGFIENQRVYSDIPYGRATLAYSGCEVIAVYNVLLDITKKLSIGNQIPNILELAKEFEKDGMVHKGLFGTAPKALKDYLEKHGLTTVFSMKNSEFENIIRNSESAILTMYNDYRNLGKQIHTIAITRNNQGYIAHNVYGNGVVVGPASSLTNLMTNINNGNARGICIIGVSKDK